MKLKQVCHQHWFGDNSLDPESNCEPPNGKMFAATVPFFDIQVTRERKNQFLEKFQISFRLSSLSLMSSSSLLLSSFLSLLLLLLLPLSSSQLSPSPLPSLPSPSSSLASSSLASLCCCRRRCCWYTISFKLTSIEIQILLSRRNPSKATLENFPDFKIEIFDNLKKN